MMIVSIGIAVYGLMPPPPARMSTIEMITGHLGLPGYFLSLTSTHWVYWSYAMCALRPFRRRG